MSKVRSIGKASELRGAHGFLAELEDQGFDAVIVCGIRRNEDSSTNMHPAVFGPFRPADVVLACQRMIWLEMADIDEQSGGGDDE